MDLRALEVGPLQTNCYLIGNEDQLLIVDPGFPSPELLNLISEDGRRPAAIILTHGHFDHIMGIDSIKEIYNIPVYALDKEKQTFENADGNLAMEFLNRPFSLQSEISYFEEGQMPELAGLSFETFWVPGHTPGGCCYYLPEEGLLFAGDNLFYGSVGRTDGPYGDMDAMISALKEKILTLPDQTRVLPGHGPMTEIAFEKRHNPYLR